jgi:hypothetical protein
MTDIFVPDGPAAHTYVGDLDLIVEDNDYNGAFETKRTH